MEDPRENLEGVQVDKYQIHRLLGKGGMASVYEATQESINRTVAIKVLPASLLHDGTFMARFRQEAEVVARLEHFHILPIYDYGEFRGMPYIVMRNLEGGTVEDLIAEGPLPWADVIQITEQIAEALDYAHARSVIHRDIKPSNILLDVDGNAYLADFGIAKVAEGTANLTGSGIIGTPAYMAPEQSESGPPTPAMDVYALGCMIYEMLTGRIPFNAETPISLIMAHIQKPVPSIYDDYPDAPNGLQDILERSMAKHPEERYSSAGELASALSRVLSSGENIDYPPETAPMGAETLMSMPARSAPTRQADRLAEPVIEAEDDATGGVNWMLVGGIAGAVLLVVVIGVLLLGGNGDREADAVSGQDGTPVVETAETRDEQSTPEPTESAATATDDQSVVVNDDSTATPTPPPAETPTMTPTPMPTPTVTATPLPERTFLRGVPMLLMPEGNFSMGKEGDNSYPRERPAHSVYLDAYYIDETEVTNAYYRACVENEGCPYPEFTQVSIWPDYFSLARFDNYPVAYISWAEAQNYCRWRGGHLPTEAQWEKAARFDPETGAQTTLFPWGEVEASLFYTNYGSEINRAEPVGERPAGASPIGAQDMAGNMTEWIFDWYLDNYYEQSPRENPLGPETGTDKVLRGGSYTARGRLLAVTWREYIGPGTKQDWIGFRCAYTPSGDPTLGHGEQPELP